MTPAEVLALPAVVDVPTAARVLGIGETLAYGLVRRDAFPCEVLRLGRLLRVPRSGLLEVLGIPDTREAGAPTPALALAIGSAATTREVPRAATR
jgi:hypothetical protein